LTSSNSLNILSDKNAITYRVSSAVSVKRKRVNLCHPFGVISRGEFGIGWTITGGNRVQPLVLGHGYSRSVCGKYAGDAF
jgi:hypothetical protein